MKSNDSMPKQEKVLRIEDHFKRNTAGITLVEFFWGLGLPVLIESTFLQIFLTSLGASKTIIGLPPVFLSIGIAICSLFSAYFTMHLRHKKNIVVLVHIMAALPIIAFGAFLSFLPASSSSVLSVFLLCYACFALGIGLTLPIWQNYLVKIFSEKHSIRALSVMSIVQNLSKIFCSIFLFKIVQRFSMDIIGIRLIFILVGIFLFCGSFFFLFTKETSDDHEFVSHGLINIADFVKALKAVFTNRNFLFFLGNDIAYFAGASVISFYGIYAKEHADMSPEIISGLFPLIYYLGAVIAQFIFGWLQILSLRNKFIISKLLTLIGILLLVFIQTSLSFFITCFCLGASIAIRLLIYPPALKRIANTSETTAYFALATILILPVSAGLPFLSGRFLDLFSGLGSWNYKYLFLFMAFLILLSFFFLFKIDFKQKKN